MLRRASKRSAKEAVKSKGGVSSTNTLDNPLGSTKPQERGYRMITKIILLRVNREERFTPLTIVPRRHIIIRS
jgi:hypothetical protein